MIRRHQDLISVVSYRSDDVRSRQRSFFSKSKETLIFLSSIKSNLDYMKELICSYKENKNSNNLCKIYSVIATLQDIFKSVKLLGQTDHDNLHHLEKSLLSEIKFLKDYVFLSDKFNKIKINNSLENNIVKSNNASCKKKFENNITIGHFTHSWHCRDHILFMNIYNKYSSPKMETTLYRVLSHISPEEINMHCEKYAEYIQKSKETKLKIETWKRERIENIKKDNALISSVSVGNDPKVKSGSDLGTVRDKEKIKLKQLQLSEWKDMKLKRTSPITLFIKSPCNHNHNYQYSNQEREIIKKKVECYKREKIVEKDNLKVLESYKLKQKFQQKNNNLATFQERDKAFIKVKLSMINTKKLVNNSRYMQNINTRKEAVLSSKDRTENYKNVTFSYLHHLLSNESKSHAMANQMHIDYTKKRSIPSWRVPK